MFMHMPSTGVLALMAMGTPANGRSSRGVMPSAAASARSPSTSTNAFSAPSSASIRRSAASTISHADAEPARLVLDQQRERAGEHHVDLLLARVAVDAAALAGLQHDQVQPERAAAELLAQALEALGGVDPVGVEAGERHGGVHGRIVAAS